VNSHLEYCTAMESCTIDELIEYILELDVNNDNLPVIFHDQGTVVRFNNLSEVIKISQSASGTRYLSIGGFHINGAQFFDNTDIDTPD
jgi:hypothetical protein